MKPAPFQYEAPTSVPEACRLLSWHADECKLLAGGQSLGPLLNLRMSTPSVLIDLRRIAELRESPRLEGNMLRIGAMTTYQELLESAVVREHAPLLRESVPYIGHQAIRNAGTVGGSVAHADPAAELPTVLVALEAAIRVRSIDGERLVPARDFFTGIFSTALGEAEMVVGIEVRAAKPEEASAWIEVAPRQGDYAVVGVATTLHIEDGRIKRARLALSGVGDRPHLASAVRQLEGLETAQAPIDEVARAVRDEVSPRADLVSSIEYKQHLVAKLTTDALRSTMLSPSQRKRKEGTT